MYRILVVDDEPYIVDWICDLIENESGMETDVYRAYSAIDALKWLEKAKMDILITDIRMPVMDGLSLLERVNQTWPYCKVILITGHAEFDYAYNAIRHNAVGYILKTEKDDKILAEVKKAADLVDKDIRNTEILKTAGEKVREAEQVVAKDWFHKMMRGDHACLPDIKNTPDRIVSPIDLRKSFFLVLGRLDILPERATSYEKFQMIRQVEGIVDHFLSSHVSNIPVEYANMRLLWFVQPHEKPENSQKQDMVDHQREKTVTFVMGMLESAQRSCRENLGVSLSLIIGNTPVTADAFAERFDGLEQLLYYHVNDKAEALLTDGYTPKKPGEEIPLLSDPGKSRVKLNRLEVLETYLENGQQKEFKAEMDEICEALRNIRSRNSNVANEIYYSLALMFLSYINRRNIAEKIAFSISTGKLTRADDHTSWNEAADYLYQLAEAIFELHKKDRQQATVDIIEFIRNYVKNNMEDVSLIKLSEVTGYNPTYLSRFYKSSSGENLYDYISAVRMKRAKQLLKDTDRTLNEISIQVGFTSRSCFNRFFRRLAGMAPQEYRDAAKQGK